jgi:hypothetical protein
VTQVHIAGGLRLSGTRSSEFGDRAAFEALQPLRLAVAAIDEDPFVGARLTSGNRPKAALLEVPRPGRHDPR